MSENVVKTAILGRLKIEPSPPVTPYNLHRYRAQRIRSLRPRPARGKNSDAPCLSIQAANGPTQAELQRIRQIAPQHLGSLGAVATSGWWVHGDFAEPVVCVSTLRLYQNRFQQSRKSRVEILPLKPVHDDRSLAL
jgi:hypothetical protein